MMGIPGRSRVEWEIGLDVGNSIKSNRIIRMKIVLQCV